MRCRAPTPPRSVVVRRRKACSQTRTDETDQRRNKQLKHPPAATPRSAMPRQQLPCCCAWHAGACGAACGGPGPWRAKRPPRPGAGPPSVGAVVHLLYVSVTVVVQRQVSSTSDKSNVPRSGAAARRCRCPSRRSAPRACGSARRWKRRRRRPRGPARAPSPRPPPPGTACRVRWAYVSG